MKKILLALTAIAALFISCKSQGDSSVLEGPRNKEGEWIAKINFDSDSFVIYEGQFENEFEQMLEQAGVPKAQRAMSMESVEYKQQAIDTLISEYLVVKKAEENDFFESEEAKRYIASQMRKAKMQYYFQKKYMSEEKLAEIEAAGMPSEENLRAVYEQYKDSLAERGYTEYNEETKQYLAKLLGRQQTMMGVQQKIQSEINSLKEQYVIEKNDNILGSGDDMLNLTGPGGGFSGMPNIDIE